MTKMDEAERGDAPPTGDARERIIAAMGAAILLAGLILVAFVLPAEYGVDPLGTGARLGLLDLGIMGQQVDALEETAGGAQATLVAQESPFREETVDFNLRAGEGMEYKYRLERGESLLYSWKSTGPVNFEFHAEPDGGPRGYAQTYEKADGRSEASGNLTAPFPGIHGWFWENKTDQPVTVTLTSAGFYDLAYVYREGASRRTKRFQ
jgi:hypothetical protein